MYFGATVRLSRDASKWATKILPALASFTSNCDSSLVCQNKTRQAGGGGALVNGFCKSCQDTFELGREESAKTKVYSYSSFSSKVETIDEKLLHNHHPNDGRKYLSHHEKHSPPKGNTWFHFFIHSNFLSSQDIQLYEMNAWHKHKQKSDKSVSALKKRRFATHRNPNLLQNHTKFRFNRGLQPTWNTQLNF